MGLLQELVRFEEYARFECVLGGCTGVAEFTIPATVESIGDSAFKNWTQAQTVYLPAGLDTSAWNKNWLAGCDAAVVEQ